MVNPASPPLSSNGVVLRMAFAHYGSTMVVQGLILLLGIATGVLSARILGPAGRGAYAAIVIWPLWIASLVACGINQGIAFYLGRRTLTVSQAVTAAGSIGIVQSAISVAAGLVVVPLALQRYAPEANELGTLFVFFTPVCILGAYTGNVFQGLQDLLRFDLIRATVPLTYAAGLVVLLLAHRGSLALVIEAQLAGYTLCLIVGSILIWNRLRPRFSWGTQAIPRLIKYGVRIHAANLTSQFNQRADQLVLSLFVAPRELGLYVLAVTLSMVVNFFPYAAGLVSFSRGSSQNRELALKTIGTSFRASLAWLLVSCSVLYAVSPYVIHLAFNGAFDGSILACRILLPGTVMLGLNQVLYSGAGALGRPGLPTYAEGAGIAVTAVGLYLLVPHYGYIGAAVISSVAYTLSFLVMLFLARRVLGMSLRTLFLG